MEITENSGSEKRLLLSLKDYYNENEYIAASIICTLKLLDPDIIIPPKGQKLEINSGLYNIDIRPRIDDANAQPRLFFNKEKIAFISTNENVKNFVDILAVKNVIVYVIGVDYKEDTLYVYKINRDNRYFEVIERFMDEIIRGSDVDIFK